MWENWDDVGYSTIIGSTAEESEDESHRNNVEMIHSKLSASLSKAYIEVKNQSPEEYARMRDLLFEQLREYIDTIAENYYPSPFHSFHHAKQVVLNTNHLIELSIKHPGTWTISHAQAFCLLFAALVHDVDHWGLTNAYMIKENLHGLSTKYPDGSLAEHKSIDLSIKLLKESKFDKLREVICGLNFHQRTPTTNPRMENHDLSVFEGVITTLILSTDIMNPQRIATSRSKWDQTFNTPDDAEAEQLDGRDEAILEQLLQLADIGHCTQRWETLIAWNQRLLTELVSASKAGRGIDPSDVWFNGQISFFDNYIVPLTERIRISGIFSNDISDTFLLGTLRNKVRWTEEGVTLCERMKEIARSDASPRRFSTSSIEFCIDHEVSKAPLVRPLLQLRPSMSSTAPPTSAYSENAIQSQRNIWSR